MSGTPTMLAPTTMCDPRQLGNDIYFVQANTQLSATRGAFSQFISDHSSGCVAKGTSTAVASREAAALDCDSSNNSSQVGNSRDSSVGPSTAPTTPPDSKPASIKDADSEEDKRTASQGLSRKRARPEEEPAEKAKKAKATGGRAPEAGAVKEEQGEEVFGIGPRTSGEPEGGRTLPRKEAVIGPAKRKAADNDCAALGAPATQRIKTQSCRDVKVKGIANPNYLCYRNSALQLLASCKIFREELAKHLAGPCKVVGACVACGLATFFAGHFHSGDSRFKTNPTKPIAGFKQALPKPFNRLLGQEDAFEYITAVLSTIENQLTKGLLEPEKKSHPVYRAFNGCFPSVVRCSLCGHESSNNNEGVSMVMEPLTPRSEREVIPLRNKLVQYFSAEDVEYRCEKCKKPGGKATKRITVRSGPEFLIVNIARHKPAKFAWKKGAKVRNHVSFHEKLSLPETPASGKRKLAHYKLQAVLAHAGSTMSGGHYISYVQQPDGTWAECNDDSVTEVSLKAVLSCDGGHFQACVLGYSKVH